VWGVGVGVSGAWALKSVCRCGRGHEEIWEDHRSVEGNNPRNSPCAAPGSLNAVLVTKSCSFCASCVGRGVSAAGLGGGSALLDWQAEEPSSS
jgi:hypothetical protein